MTPCMGLKPGQLLHVTNGRTHHRTQTSVFGIWRVYTATPVLSSSYQLLDATALSRLPGFALRQCCGTLLSLSLSISVKETQKYPHPLPMERVQFLPLYLIRPSYRETHFTKVNGNDLMCLQKRGGYCSFKPLKVKFLSLDEVRVTGPRLNEGVDIKNHYTGKTVWVLSS